MNKTLLAYLLIVGISGTAGAGTGVVLKRTLGPVDEVYPPGFNPDEYKADVDSLYDEYLTNKSSFINSAKNPALVNVALEKYRRSDNSWSFGVGNADAGITVQTVRSAQVKRTTLELVDDKQVTKVEYFEEQISDGLIGVAKRSYQHGKDGPIDVYDGETTGAETANYNTSPSSMSVSAYKDYLGKSLDEMFIYIISDMTTISSSKKSLGGGNLEINLSLNVSLATYYYKIQMKAISGLSNLPPFTNVNLTYTLSKDLDLKTLAVDETYTATKEGIPVPAKTHNIIKYYYYPDVELDIPDINTDFKYAEKE